MKRLALALVPLAVVVSACAVGDPQPPSDLTELSATLNGNVFSTAQGDTEYWFRYGETKAYGSETPHGTVAISDDQAHPVSKPIEGLSPGTTYHWQLCVNDHSPNRDICNKDHTFRTIAPADATTPTYKTDHTVTLNGKVASSVAGQAEYWFEYEQAPASGKAALSSQSLANQTPHQTITVAAGAPQTVSTLVSGLAAGTTYNFTMCANTPAGLPTTCSPVSSFTTAASGSGRSGIAFRSNRDGPLAELYVADGGQIDRLTAGDGAINRFPAWSPDGSKVVFSKVTSESGGFQNFDLFVMNADGSGVTQLTDTPGTEASASWSPDGTKIAFDYTQPSPRSADIYTINADGTGRTLLTATEDGLRPGWSPDGGKIIYSRFLSGEADLELFTMNPDGSAQTQLTDTAGKNDMAKYSPDGRSIAFVSGRDDATHYQLYTMDADGGNQTKLLDLPSGFVTFPSWSPDGSQIAVDNRIGGGSDAVEVYTIATGDLQRLTSDGPPPGSGQLLEDEPNWSPRP